MKTKTLIVKATFTEPMLGTKPFDAELYDTWLSEKAPGENIKEEIEDIDVEQEVEKASTGFLRDDGNPYICDYQVKGFFKGACGMLLRVEGSLSSKLKAYKKVIDGNVFVEPRKIMLRLPEKTKVEWFTRPIRISGPRGDRTALARSEMVPAGTVIDFEVLILCTIKYDLEELVREWLEYGKLHGIGQWRNASYGRIECEISDG